jgi:hypothetical protein
MDKIKEVEEQAEKNAKLTEWLKDSNLLREGYRPSVRLSGKKKDKRRNASFEKHWSPETDSIRIEFEPISERPVTAPESIASGAVAAPQNQENHSGDAAAPPMPDLIRALDRAESRGLQFVALKWFRDVALDAEGFAWANDPAARQKVIGDGIQRRLILTRKVPNPKSPQFPVTAIYLNRLMPEVIAILGGSGQGVGGFQPVPIRGEDLSVTVMRDRR